MGFSKNRRHLELVREPGNRVISSIYLKMGVKAVISEKRVARSLYYLGNVLQAICGPIVFIRNLSIFSFSVGFSKNQRHLELVWDPGDKVMSLIYLKLNLNLNLNLN